MSRCFVHMRLQFTRNINFLVISNIHTKAVKYFKRLENILGTNESMWNLNKTMSQERTFILTK